MEPISQAEAMEVHRHIQMSILYDAINRNPPSDLVVRLRPGLPTDAIDRIVRDLQPFGATQGPHLDIGALDIGITPRDTKSANAVVEYSRRNPHLVDHVDVDGVITFERLYPH